MRDEEIYDAIVIGGGPAGSVVGRLLALWGHRVVIVAAGRPRERGMAESIPPSARKLLATVGVLDVVERAGFPLNRGNIVWWGEADGRVEDFGDSADGGFQVFRPDFDALLLDDAERAGAQVLRDTVVRAVAFDDDRPATIEVEHLTTRRRLTAHLLVDCSGRTGVIARRGYRLYEPQHRMQALIGVWTSRGGDDPGLAQRTAIETYEDGWAWSLPLGTGMRQLAVMVDGTTTSLSRGRGVADTLIAELAKTHRVRRLVDGATLTRAWACDASMHAARAYAGRRFMLVGDAATCIDPLSSFGVKKALSSAWLAAVALHTAFIDEARRQVAFEFFAAREREVYAAELARTEEYAQRALGRHPHPFWRARGDEPRAVEPSAIDARLRSDDVRAAFDRIRSAPAFAWRWRPGLQFAPQPVVRGREVVVEPGLPIGTGVTRFAAGTDLVTLGNLASTHGDVPTIYARYCEAHGAVPLPQVLAALSLLLAEGLLE